VTDEEWGAGVRPECGFAVEVQRGRRPSHGPVGRGLDHQRRLDFGMIVNRPQWQPAYNASKAAVHQLTRSLAAEWAGQASGSTRSHRVM